MRESLRPIMGSHQRALGVAVDRYHSSVIDALEWLEARGITASSASTFRLGVVDDPIPGHERYKGMLSIPYQDMKGEITQIRFRCLQPHDCRAAGHGKYLTMTGDEARLFNISALGTEGDTLHVTEGEFDAMILSQLGLPAVGCPGAATWKHRHTVGASSFNAVYLWGDGDKAGRDEFNARIYSELDNARIVHVPDGEDVSSLYIKQGEDALRRLLEDSIALYGGSA